MSPGGSTLSFGTQTSRPAKHKVMGTGSKSLADWSLGVRVTAALIPGPVDPGCGGNGTIQ